MITIWGRKNSSNVQAAMWAVGELGLEHERLDWGGKFGGNDEPDYRGMYAKVRVVPTADIAPVSGWL